MHIETADGRVRVRRGSARDPDAILSGPAPVIAQVLIYGGYLAEARERGLDFEGDPEAVRRIARPAAEVPSLASAQ